MDGTVEAGGRLLDGLEIDLELLEGRGLTLEHGRKTDGFDFGRQGFQGLLCEAVVEGAIY